MTIMNILSDNKIKDIVEDIIETVENSDVLQVIGTKTVTSTATGTRLVE